MSLARDRVGHRFIATSLSVIVLVVTSATLGLLRFAAFRSSSAAAASASGSTQAAASLEAIFWHESGAALAHMSRPAAGGLRAVDALHREFQREAAGGAWHPSAADKSLLTQAAREEDAYHRMALLFHPVAGPARGQQAGAATARMNAAAGSVLAPLRRLDRVARARQQASQQAESAASGQVLMLAGAALLGGGLVGAALAVFAGRLLGQAFRREEQLTSALAQLRELDHMKDELIALVSHELRTPLTSIVGFLELLEGPEAGRLDEQQRAFARAIHRNADRLRHLAADVLVLAGMQSGKLTMRREDTDLASLARRAVGDARPEAERRNITLTLSAGPVPPVPGDGIALAQILGNLLSNALKFTPEGGDVRVAVTAEPGSVVLTVADTGIGISPGDQEHIFERFYRAPVAGRRAIQGSGLGLTICKALVDAHGGSISVTSETGRGTAFRVSFPAGPARTAAIQVTTPAVALGLQARARGRGSSRHPALPSVHDQRLACRG